MRQARAAQRLGMIWKMASLYDRAFSEVPFWNSAEYGIDFTSRNSAEFFTVQYREIPLNSAEFRKSSCIRNPVYLQMKIRN